MRVSHTYPHRLNDRYSVRYVYVLIVVCPDAGNTSLGALMVFAFVQVIEYGRTGHNVEGYDRVVADVADRHARQCPNYPR